MAIKVTAVPEKTPMSPGTVRIEAKAVDDTGADPPAISGVQWQEKKPDAPSFVIYTGDGAQNITVEVKTTGNEGTQYRASVALAGDPNPKTTEPVTILIDEDASPAAETPAVEKLAWPGGKFAWTSLAILVAAGAAFIVWVQRGSFGRKFVGEERGFPVTADGATAYRAALAADLTKPLLLLGTGLVVIGLWMTLLEWRAQFVTPGAILKGGVADAVSLIEALGKLKGATLVLITGVVVLLGPAWIGASAAGSDPPTTSTPPPPTSTAK